ncbi:NAD(P)-binding protein [Schizopora paradoxa]|uniref:NAD(P)-binding protein n=1 Tax=Schizopora paradoxa TaxID=27342 RepID=A0A0H2SCM3_9AGAM|nr:NAD(P)-binding protein [Schizopora paradoxa]
MASGVAPKDHHSVYPAIAPENFIGALENKVALVTGAGRGVGKAIAFALAHAGAHVALLARTKSQLDEVAEEIKAKYNRNVLVFPVDATNQPDVAAAFEKAERELGKIDILVANAAIIVWRPFLYSDFNEDFKKIMDVNFTAPFFLIQLSVKSMHERKSGVVIAISSQGGILRFAATAAYSASKAALNTAIGVVQLELDAQGESGVQLYALSPGTVKTDMLGMYGLHEKDMEKMQPGSTKWWRDLHDSAADPPELCAQTCVYLATGKAKELRGRHIDAVKDIQSIVDQADIVKRENLYDMCVKELGR